MRNVNLGGTKMKIETVQEEIQELSILELPKKKKDLLKSELTYKFIKRAIDIIGSLVGIMLLVPMTIGIYIANLIIGDKGPVFYSQNRIGKDGKIFKMYKFRSMVVGADEKLKQYLAENEEAREEYRINKKLKNDPRVTKIGKFIRKTSIDEFPQFMNVLKGDIWQVSGRNDVSLKKD